ALRDAALDLAVDEHGIERHAAIIDGSISGYSGNAGLRVDLDFADMAAIGKGLRHVDLRLGVERIARLGGGRGGIEQRDRTIRAGDAIDAGAVFEVDLRGFQEARRPFAALFDDRLDGAHARRARGHGAARRDGAAAFDIEPRIAEAHDDLLFGKIEALGGKTAEDRGMALAGRPECEIERHRPVAGKRHRRALDWRAAGMLEKT